MFQYKVIHNILPNQVSLFRAGIANNDTCPLCNAKKTAQRSHALQLSRNHYVLGSVH